jgi:hypothetical protein
MLKKVTFLLSLTWGFGNEPADYETEIALHFQTLIATMI